MILYMQKYDSIILLNTNLIKVISGCPKVRKLRFMSFSKLFWANASCKNISKMLFKDPWNFQNSASFIFSKVF